MTRRRKKLLAAIGEWETFRRLEPLFARAVLEVNRVSDGPSCLALATSVRYDLILAEERLAGTTPAALVRALRLANSRSRRSPLLLLVAGGYTASPPPAPELTRDDALTLRVSPEQVRHTVSEALGLALRTDSRLLVNLEVDTPGAPLSRVCQMLNLSSSGMLLRTRRPVPVGTRVAFSFGLPDDPSPVTGSFQVIRHTQRPREELPGMGVKFLDLEGTGAERLTRYVRGEIARAERSARAGS